MVRRLYELAFGRPPTEQETAQAIRFLQQYRETLNDGGEKTGANETPDAAAWQGLCRAIVMTNEFLYLN